MNRILLAAALAVAFAVASIALLVGCGGNPNPPPVVAPNPNGADCLAERQMLQLTCVQHYTTKEAIDKCLAEAKLPDCTTEAGITAYVTSRDAGADK
jgi:hypothetical protein